MLPDVKDARNATLPQFGHYIVAQSHYGRYIRKSAGKAAKGICITQSGRLGMPEFNYRGYRIRTLFDRNWQVKVWPPLTPAKLTERVQASRAEGEDACRVRVTTMIDTVLKRKSSRKVALES
jgi:hypothetical protein